MATPSLTCVALDANNDPVFNNTPLSGTDAVAQAILTRLRLFYGEWWEDLSQGLPVFQQILGQLASASGLAAMQLAVARVISGTPYVTSVTSLTLSFNNGVLNFQASVQTAFGPVTVSNLPGQSATID